MVERSVILKQIYMQFGNNFPMWYGKYSVVNGELCSGRVMVTMLVVRPITLFTYNGYMSRTISMRTLKVKSL